MERENYTEAILDKSRFEEGAREKIAVKKDYESGLTEANLTIENGLRGGKSIKDKLKDFRYESSTSGKEVEEIYQTETERHNGTTTGKGAKAVDAAGKEEYVSSNLFQPVAKNTNHIARGQSYMNMMSLLPKEKNKSSGKYVKDNHNPEKEIESQKKTGSSQERISKKAKGNIESKEKVIQKAKDLKKETFGNKIHTQKSAAGKYKKKIGTGKKDIVKNVVAGSVKSSIKAKLWEDSDENVGVESVRGTKETFSSAYQYFHRGSSSLSSVKYGKKASVEQKKGGQHSGGKYAKKADSKQNTQQNKAAIQKRAQQRNTEKKFRNAKKKEKTLNDAVQEGKQKLIKVAKKVQEFISKHLKLCLVVGAILIMIIVISAALSSCAMAFSSGSGSYVGGLSPADDVPMTGCENYYTEKEMILQERIDKIQEEYPDYDEYVMDIAPVGHDATKLMAFLSSVYESYDLSMVQGVLDTLFDEMYTLIITEKIEIRTRMVYNEETGLEEEEEYEWKILYVTLEKKDWDSLIESKFPDMESRELYDIYVDTGGAHQSFYNPFPVDWTEHISSEFGWRIHPVLGYEKFHNGVDIALPAGTEIHACTTGTVIQSYMSQTAGNYVVVQDETGYTCHYMHLSVRSVKVGDTIKHGDIVGKVGSTGRSTGPHLHLGVKDAAGEWLNPRFLVSNFTQ